MVKLRSLYSNPINTSQPGEKQSPEQGQESKELAQKTDQVPKQKSDAVDCEQGWSCPLRPHGLCPCDHPLLACPEGEDCDDKGLLKNAQWTNVTENCKFSHESLCDNPTTCAIVGCEKSHQEEDEEPIIIEEDAY